MTHAPPHVRFLQCSFTTLRSGQTLVQELPQTPLPEQSAAVHLAPAVVSAPVRLLALRASIAHDKGLSIWYFTLPYQSPTLV